MTVHSRDSVQPQPEQNVAGSISENLSYAGDVLAEFASSAWQSGAVNKYRGVAQPFSQDGTPPAEPEKELQGAMQLAHTAGAAAGEIFDLAVATSLLGRGFIALGGSRLLMGTGFGSLMEGATARGIATGATVGALDGGIFTPVKEGESNWRRVGNAFVEGGTFAVMNGMAGHIGDSYGTNLAGRLKTNALSGGIAGVANVNLDAWSHGKLASTEDMLMSGAGWAIGGMAIGEGAKLAGDGLGLGMNAIKSWRAKNFTGIPETGIAAAAETSSQEIHLERDGKGTSTDAVGRDGKSTPAEIGTRAAAEPPPLMRTAGIDEAAAEAAAEARGEKIESGPRAFLDPTKTVSMRKLAREWGLQSDQALPETATQAERDAYAQRLQKFDEMFDEYYKHFEAAFPMPGEIEKKEALMNRYLLNGKSTWDAVILRDAEDRTIGGIHFQTVHVPDAEVLRDLAWAEHIFLRKDGELNARAGRNFLYLKDIAQKSITDAGGKWVVMEFNNPNKMSEDQQDADAEGGLGSTDRLWVWGRAGIHVPVTRKGAMPEYGQPDMDFYSLPAQVKNTMRAMDEGRSFDEAYKSVEAEADPDWMKSVITAVRGGKKVTDGIAEKGEPPKPVVEGEQAEEPRDGSVRFLSTGFVSAEPISGKTIPTSDVNKVFRAMHRTIPTVDVETDPTVEWYSRANNEIPDQHLTMVPLTTIARAREAATAAYTAATEAAMAAYTAAREAAMAAYPADYTAVMEQQIQQVVQRALQLQVKSDVDELVAGILQGDHNLNEQELQALPGAIQAAVKASMQNALKSKK